MPKPTLKIIPPEPPITPGVSPARAALPAALVRETDLTLQIDDTRSALDRCRQIIAAAPGARIELDRLESAHNSEVEIWAQNGALGPSPHRDDAKFQSARQSVREAEANLEAAQTGAQSLQQKLQTLLEAFRSARAATTDLIQNISLEESERLFVELAEAEKKRAKLRADVMGLAFVLEQSALRGDQQAVRAGNNLRVQLETVPPEPSEMQCQASRSAWTNFADRLRNDPQANYAKE